MFSSQFNSTDISSVLLSRLQSKLNVWFWSVNLSTMQCTLSEKLDSMCGFKRPVHTFDDFLEYVHPDNKEQVRARAAGRFLDSKLSYPIMTVDGYSWVDSEILERIVNDLGQEVVYGGISFLNRTYHQEGMDNQMGVPHLSDFVSNTDTISNSLRLLLGNSDSNVVIHDLLESLRDQFNGDRSYIIEYNHSRWTQSCIHEAVATGVESEVEFIQDLDMNITRWWTENLLSKKPIVINHIDELPSEAKSEWEILNSQGIKSVIVAPMVSGNEVWGYIGIDIVGHARSWSGDDRRWFLALSYLLGICLSLKKTESVALLEKEQFTDLYENMPLGFIRVSLVRDQDDAPVDFIFRDVNTAFCDILGLSYSEVIGSSAREKCQDVYEPFLPIIYDIVDDNGVDRRSYTLYREGRYYETTMYITRNRDVVCLFYDNTEVIQTANTLRHKEETLRSIYDNIPVGVEIYDKNGALIDLNNMDLAIFGLSDKSAVLGINLFDNPNIQQEYKDTLRQKQPVELSLTYDFDVVSAAEYYTSVHHSQVKNLRAIGNVILDANGEIETYMFIVIDNTDSSRVSHALYEFELLFNSISEFSAIGLCRWRPNDRKLVATDQWYENLCQEPRPMGDIRDAYTNVHPDDLQKLERVFSEMITGEIDVFSDQFRIRSGDEWKWLRSYFKRQNIDDLHNSMIIGLNIDISESKAVELELIEARKKAEEADTLKSAFIANMSHEIRTPLNAIVGFSDLLVSDDCDQQEQEQYISIIRSNNDLLLQLISDILDLSKMEAGVIDISNDEVYVGVLCDEAVTSHRFRVAPGVRLICDKPLSEHCVHTDKNRVSQVLVNLITNAIKFTERGEIRVGYEVIRGFVKFYVKDTGVGISSDQLLNIFDRFVKLNSFATGTGLGLAICKTIIDHLGGDIWVESEFGRGSCFYFTIPYDNTIEDMNKIELGALGLGMQHNAHTDRINSKPLVLIAEDTDSNYLLVSIILRDNYTLVRAINGVEAVNLCQQHKPDVILMDIRMPEMDGLEATRIIRSKGYTTPIIALTAFAFDSDKEKAISAGCNEFVTKPINPGELKSVVAKYIVL